MKAWLILFLLASPVLAEEIDPGGDGPQTVSDELYDIYDKMREMEDSLRGDKTNARVQLNGKEIEDQLDKLIKEIEEAKESDRPPRGKVLAERWKKLRSLASDNPKPRTIPPGSVRPSSESRIPVRNSWYNLPPDARGEMIQTYAAELPLKWKARIAAYFISIAVEEVKVYSPPSSSNQQPHKAQ